MNGARGENPEILLVNSFSPRRRSMSDVFLDNGMAMLRARLGRSGYRVAIEDANTVDGFARVSPSTFTRPLRRIAMKMIERRAGKLEIFVFRILQLLLSLVQAWWTRWLILAIVRRVRRQNIPVVGVKVWYGDAFRWSEALVMALRRHCPEVITIAGGPHANVYNQDGLILRHSHFDLAIYGEGEEALEHIVGLVRRGATREERLALIRAASPANVIWRREGGVNVNPMAFQRVNDKPVPEYTSLAGKARIHTIVDAMGCDYNKCSFCAHKTIYGSYRRRAPAAVVDEMEAMSQRGIGLFRFAAGDTPLPQASAIAQEIATRGLKVEFSMFHRAARGAGKRTSELVEGYRLLIRAGLRAVFMGLETGDDRINCEILKKNTVAQDTIDTLAALRKARETEERPCLLALATIHPVPSGGIPWGDIRRKTREVALAAQADSVLIAPPGVFPGTQWYERPEAFGFRLGARYVENLMRYDYVLYKPVELWQDGAYWLDGKSAKEIFAETARLRCELEDAGVVTDLGDEDFILMQAAGLRPADYRRESLADIISCDGEWSRRIINSVNAKSLALAGANIGDRLAVDA
ncbi:MAG: cobalamin B12-binding domain-containing protein [Elusimicrobia bacterium]|nr:cobalamin B12-binding domain-containing protein [Elusimicrobiota bacterium]